MIYWCTSKSIPTGLTPDYINFLLLKLNDLMIQRRILELADKNALIVTIHIVSLEGKASTHFSKSSQNCYVLKISLKSENFAFIVTLAGQVKITFCSLETTLLF